MTKGESELDYIRQINAFENLNEYSEIGPGAQLLWYKLMRVANLSGWQKELSISNTRLQSMTKTSEKTLINNRNQLIQNGLLQYKKRGRTKAGIYILADLTENFPVKNTVVNPPTGNIPVNTTVIPTVDTTVNSSVDTTVDSSAYINKTKLNETNKDEDIGVYEFIQMSWGKPPTGILQGALGPMIKKWGSDMILFAFKLAFENNVELRGLKKYVDVILASWSKAGINNLNEAIESQEEFKRNKKVQKPSGYQKNTRREKLPEWASDPEGYNKRKEQELNEKFKNDDWPF